MKTLHETDSTNATREEGLMTALFINLHVSLNETCNKTSELTFTM